MNTINPELAHANTVGMERVYRHLSLMTTVQYMPASSQQRGSGKMDLSKAVELESIIIREAENTHQAGLIEYSKTKMVIVPMDVLQKLLIEARV